MSTIPLYADPFGFVRRSTSYNDLRELLSAEELARFDRSIMTRFWAYAHFYTSVLTLILSMKGYGDEHTALYLLGFGSLVLIVLEPLSGVFADALGSAHSMRRGMLAMMGYAVLGCVLSLWNYGREWHLPLQALLQLVACIPLAFLAKSDTTLTRSTLRDRNDLPEPLVNATEGMGSAMKYQGVALGAGVGFLVYFLVRWCGGDAGWAAAAVFTVTALAQFIALRWLKPFFDEEAASAGTTTVKRTSWWSGQRTRFGSAIEKIRKHRSLAQWILVMAAVEGWLLFSTFLFTARALREWANDNMSSWWVILVSSIVVWILYVLGSRGGSVYARWRHASSSSWLVVKLLGARSDGITSRNIMVFRIIIAIGLIYVSYQLLSEFLQSEPYLLTATGLLISALLQFIRGFAQPFLRNTMMSLSDPELAEERNTVLSVSQALSRAFHVLALITYAVIFSWMDAGQATDPASALSATLMVVIMGLMTLNILSSLSLGRLERPAIPWSHGFKGARELWTSRGFRLLLIKCGFFVCLVLSNILGVKLIALGAFTFNAGALCYVLTVFFLDIVNEEEGLEDGRKLWLVGVLSYPLVLIGTYAAGWIPGTAVATTGSCTDCFDQIMSTQVPMLLLSSFMSFTISQLCGVVFFDTMKRAFERRALWVRNNITVFVVQVIDTIVFTLMISLLSGKTAEWLPYLQGQLMVKWAFSAMLLSTLLLFAVRWVRKGQMPPPAQ